MFVKGAPHSPILRKWHLNELGRIKAEQKRPGWRDVCVCVCTLTQGGGELFWEKESLCKRMMARESKFNIAEAQKCSRRWRMVKGEAN